MTNLKQLQEARIKFGSSKPYVAPKGPIEKGTKLLVHVGSGRVQHGEYLTPANREDHHRVKLNSGEIISAHKDDLAKEGSTAGWGKLKESRGHSIIANKLNTMAALKKGGWVRNEKKQVDQLHKEIDKKIHKEFGNSTDEK